MFVLGCVYLCYCEARAAKSTKHAEDGFSRIITGVQTGFIGLAMLVTRSSVKSLQARQGLPLGTQTVGWLVLSTVPDCTKIL